MLANPPLARNTMGRTSMARTMYLSVMMDLYHPHPGDYRRWTGEGLRREIEDCITPEQIITNNACVYVTLFKGGAQPVSRSDVL